MNILRFKMYQKEIDTKRDFTHSDAAALAALAILFILNLIASWQRWTQPLIDHGREMNLPSRILAGERLYVDVQFLYGPFAPYFNALLYGIFGIHLAILKISGAVCAIAVLIISFRIARRMMSTWEAASTTGVIMVVCAIKSSANYIQPYAYAALYALVFALCSLIFTLKYAREGKSRWIVLSGLFAGLISITKPEVALSATVAAAVALIIEWLRTRKLPWRDALLFALPAIAIAVPVYALILNRVPLQTLLEDNHVLFSNMPPQLVYFNRYVSGLLDWNKSLFFTVSGLGIFALWVGGSATFGALFSSRKERGWSDAIKIGAAILFVGIVWRIVAVWAFGLSRDVTPFASAVIVLPIVIGWVGLGIWRKRDKPQDIPPRDIVLLVIAAFSLAAILRSIINVTISSPYTPFFTPVLIIVYLYLLFCVAPAVLTKNDLIRANIRRAAMFLIAALVIGMTINSALRFRSRNTFEVKAPRGSFITERYFGRPVAEAIEFVRKRTDPGEYVLTLPQATTINFLGERRYPLREEIVHPGFVAGEAEIKTIDRIKSLNVRWIVIANILTPEFGERIFGANYNKELMRWITENYHVAARFEVPKSEQDNPDTEPFYVLIYERNE